jgi:hypothetical protein
VRQVSEDILNSRLVYHLVGEPKPRTPDLETGFRGVFSTPD